MRPVDRSKPISYDVPLRTGRKKINRKDAGNDELGLKQGRGRQSGRNYRDAKQLQCTSSESACIIPLPIWTQDSGSKLEKGNKKRGRLFTPSSCKQAKCGMPATKVKIALQNGKLSLLHRAPNVATDEEMDARCASLSTSCEPHRYPRPSSPPREPREMVMAKVKR